MSQHDIDPAIIAAYLDSLKDPKTRAGYEKLLNDPKVSVNLWEGQLVFGSYTYERPPKRKPDPSWDDDNENLSDASAGSSSSSKGSSSSKHWQDIIKKPALSSTDRMRIRKKLRFHAGAVEDDEMWNHFHDDGCGITQITDFIYVSGLQPVDHCRCTIDALGIIHCISIGNDKGKEQLPGIDTLLVDVGDSAKEDIITYFDACFEHIEKARKAKGKILVCDLFGRSPAPVVICAYLMKKTKCSPRKAFYYVFQKKKDFKPNPAFWEQLCLYSIMNHSITTATGEKKSIYRRYHSARKLIWVHLKDKWYLQGSRRRFPNLSDDWLLNLRYPKGHTWNYRHYVFQELEADDFGKLDNPLDAHYACKDCSTPLFAENNLMPSFHLYEHLPLYTTAPLLGRRGQHLLGICAAPDAQPDSGPYFIEPMDWIVVQVQDRKAHRGDIRCPGCKVKLGSWNAHEVLENGDVMLGAFKVERDKVVLGGD
ncbi:uncharacterized protein SPPG_00870 [Spizellomyces punctatus DAOM BR117]|uniref:protein-tyrosine-phosphatase n=1 Tax=Spizellomyces punctatus (strain DAOM BR117) TaxID=645134 RepID=A0A0L0HPP4_SPIPD|nr:uncharacterized protein SPPG_00870 [Spizellomyces punctatus DAOM BR117]KND03381.1 hypothetical protein SPPG_00870 [Spizellomyces punctatus DAOM BR117]|eukprot:XP_016611420.1 hypothetical protein SPPG_00870 [Spizellomyces punctatus DAOM BR117]